MTLSLYGLITRRAGEIVTILLSGYTDGAMIIWRSLYENAIVLLLLALENDNELAASISNIRLKTQRRKY